MNEEELLRQAADAPTMYFDGFGAYRKINGVIRSVGFIIGSGAQLNLIVSINGADMSNRENRRVLDEEPIKGLQSWGGKSMAH